MLREIGHTFKLSRLVASILRRGFSRCGEIGALVVFLDAVGIAPKAAAEMTSNLIGYTLVVCAASALYDLIDIVVRPDISILDENQPTLSYGDPE